MRAPVVALVVLVAVVLLGTQFSAAREGGGDMPSNLAVFKTAIFAGGCFWCMEHSFDALDGVTDVQSGFAGGHVDDPTYKQVSAGGTGHREVVQVTYNPAVIGFDKLLETYWRNIDPFDAGGQFCDQGDQYTAAIFVGDGEERTLAEVSKAAMEKRFSEKIVTAIVPVAKFYPAEEYHQDYYLKNPWRYKYYRGGCGRDKRLHEIWGDEAGGPAH